MRHASRGLVPLVVIGLVIFAAACRQQPRPQAPLDTRAADEATIGNLDTEWSKTAATKDAAQFVSYFADDATFLPPNVPTMTRKEAIQKWASDLMANPGFTLSWEPTKVEASRGGDLGYTMGTYELTLTGPKKTPVTDHGKYLTVWKKQADGGWKVVADTFNSDLPAGGTSSH